MYRPEPSEVSVGVDRGGGSRGLVVIVKSTVPAGIGLKIQDELSGGLVVPFVSNPDFQSEDRAVADWDSPGQIAVGVEAGNAQSTGLFRLIYLRGTEGKTRTPKLQNAGFAVAGAP